MNRLLALLGACAICWLTSPGQAMARQPVALITIQSVPANVIREAARFDGAEGLPLQAEDIVETMPFASLTRLEFKDGTIVDLAPDTRVLVAPQWPRTESGASPHVYLLGGWAKVSAGKGTAGAKAVVASPHADVASVARGLVMHVQGGELAMFAESGAVSGWVARELGQRASFALDPGAFLSRDADGRAEPRPRPLPAFIQAVPRPFRDTLPSRAARFEGKDVVPGPGSRLNYADVESWLNAEPRVRTRFVQRWRPLMQDAAFRRALAAQLSLHPEWRPVLFPDTSGRRATPGASAALKPVSEPRP